MGLAQEAWEVEVGAERQSLHFSAVACEHASCSSSRSCNRCALLPAPALPKDQEASACLPSTEA